MQCHARWGSYRQRQCSDHPHYYFGWQLLSKFPGYIARLEFHPFLAGTSVAQQLCFFQYCSLAWQWPGASCPRAILAAVPTDRLGGLSGHDIIWAICGFIGIAFPSTIIAELALRVNPHLRVSPEFFYSRPVGMFWYL